MNARNGIVVLMVGIALVYGNAARAASVYNNAVLADNPVAYYNMDETSGTTMVDSVASNNGTYGSGVTLNSAGPRPPAFLGMDPANAAPSFDGTTTSDAEVPAVSGLSTTAYSMEVWFNYSSTKLQYLIGRGSGASGAYDAVGQNGGTLLFFNGNTATFSATSVPQNSWHDLVLTRDPTAVDLYLDGVQVLNITSGTGFTNTFGSSTRIVVGDRPGDLNGYNPVGLFDEVSLYNTALTPEQVATHYHQALIAPEPSAALLLGLGSVGLLKRKRRSAMAAHAGLASSRNI